jgi:hypothetical protein
MLCCAMVPVYVSLFPLWKQISTLLGDRSDMVFTYLPLAVLLLFLLPALAIWLPSGKRSVPVAAAPLAAGLIICLLSLLVPDPGFPIKRIHVAEYAALSLVVRYTMSPWLRGRPLLFYSVCFAAVLGIHDEFLQGLHPARTYGLRDMAVNALGSLGGGLIWHGLNLFSAGPATNDQVTDSVIEATGGNLLERLYLGWLAAATLMLAVPAYHFKGSPVAFWTVLPLLAGPVFFSLYRPALRTRSYHGIIALTISCVALAAYPLLTALPGFVFF